MLGKSTIFNFLVATSLLIFETVHCNHTPGQDEPLAPAAGAKAAIAPSHTNVQNPEVQNRRLDLSYRIDPNSNNGMQNNFAEPAHHQPFNQPPNPAFGGAHNRGLHSLVGSGGLIPKVLAWIHSLLTLTTIPIVGSVAKFGIVILNLFVKLLSSS